MYYIGVYFSLKPQYNSVCINLNLQLIEIDYYNKKRNQSGKKLYNTIGNITKNTWVVKPFCGYVITYNE